MNLKEEILQKTNRGLEVFYFYMPIEFVPKRNFRNPLYDDKRASCNIYFDTQSQCYRMKDFGNEAYSGDCFWFTAAILGFDVRTEFRTKKMFYKNIYSVPRQAQVCRLQIVRKQKMVSYS